MEPPASPNAPDEAAAEPSSRPEGARLPSSTDPSKLLDAGTKLAVLSGAVLFAILHTGFDNFYRALGTTPELAGVTPTGVFVSSALPIIGTAVLAGALITPFVAAALAIVLGLTRGRRTNITEEEAAPMILVLAAIFVVRAGADAAWSGAIVVAIVCLLWGLAWALGSRNDVTDARAPFLTSGDLAKVFLLASVCYLGTEMVELHAEFDSAARKVIAGKQELVISIPYGVTYPFSHHQLRPTIALNARTAYLTPLAGDVPRECVIYLGESEGMLTVFDPTDRLTRRLPATSYSLAFPGGQHPPECSGNSSVTLNIRRRGEDRARHDNLRKADFPPRVWSSRRGHVTRAGRCGDYGGLTVIGRASSDQFTNAHTGLLEESEAIVFSTFSDAEAYIDRLRASSFECSAARLRSLLLKSAADKGYNVTDATAERLKVASAGDEAGGRRYRARIAEGGAAEWLTWDVLFVRVGKAVATVTFGGAANHGLPKGDTATARGHYMMLLADRMTQSEG